MLSHPGEEYPVLPKTLLNSDKLNSVSNIDMFPSLEFRMSLLSFRISSFLFLFQTPVYWNQ
jgi:hypothetical protein